ncbi:MAG TPA: lysophospholipid acyltransferase family protein, partial [Spirochaetota bacterium]|nr:lysophospholipid acyltransferase family protein [Spirochaetota bacterium]
LKEYFTSAPGASQEKTEAIQDSALAQVCAFLSRRKKLQARPESRLDLDLGLDSLDRLEMAAYLQSELGLTIAEADLARAATVAEAVSLARAATDDEVLQSGDPFDGPVEMPKLRKGTRSSARALLSFFMRHLFHLRIEGLENLPGEPCIIVANHESYLDAPTLIAKLPKRFLARSVTWIKASNVMERVVKFFSRGRNLIVVHAKSDLAATLRSSAAVIEAGYNLMVFPEGLRSRDGGLASFRPGFAMIACRTRVPVVPVAIDGALEAMPYGKTFPRFGKKICLKILSPIIPGSDETPEALADRARNSIASIVEKAHARP